jgi:hypothetical protein
VTRVAKASDLAARINAAHDEAFRSARSALDAAVLCGRLLIEAKEQTGHGSWSTWVKVHLRFGDRQARKYMQIARRVEELPNQNSDSDLTFTAALRAIASVPKERPLVPIHERVELRRYELRRADAIESLAGKMESVAGRYGTGAVAAAEKAYNRPDPRADLAKFEGDVYAEHFMPKPTLVAAARSEPTETVVPLESLAKPARECSVPTVEAMVSAYMTMTARDRNEVAKQVLEHQLGQTDLSQKDKDGLRRVLKALTAYGAQYH